jgi:hypothetical protein
MAALTDVRNQLMRVGQQIAEMRAEPSTAGAEAANGVIAELREAVRFLAERLDGVARMVAQRGEEQADTRGVLGAIDAHVRSQAETIAVLTTGMQALPSYGERVSALQDNLNGLQQRLVSIEGAFGPIGQRLGGIESAVSRPDSGVSERLAAIEGMLGPLSQRLGQALAEQAASLQALHARVESFATGTQSGLESLAAGTQAALAVPVTGDDGAIVTLEPRLAALMAELTALRQDVSALASVSPAEDVAALREQIAGLAVARPAAEGGESAVVLSEDIDAAVRRAEYRINAHVDDAVLALAQTLLGKQRGDVVGSVAPVDAAPVVAPRSTKPVDEDAADDEYDDEVEDVDDVDLEDVDVAAEADDRDDVAQIDFSAADMAEEPPAGVVAWTPAPPRPAELQPTDSYVARPAAETEAPFDQDASWGKRSQDSGYVRPGTPEGQTVVPERRRRWFSW